MQRIADELVYLNGSDQRLPQLIKDSYTDAVFDAYEMSDIIELARTLNFKNSKVIIKGKNIVESEQFGIAGADDDTVYREKHLKTKYRRVAKPDLEIKSSFEFKLPEKNQLIPD